MSMIKELEAVKSKLRAGDWFSVNSLNQPLHCETADHKFFAGIKHATVWSAKADWVKKYQEKTVDAMQWVESAIEQVKQADAYTMAFIEKFEAENA